METNPSRNNTVFGKMLLKSLDKIKYEKPSFRTWCVNNWDITLLRGLLLTFKNTETYKKENEAILELINLRNSLSHSPNNELKKMDYLKHLDTFRNACLTLGANSEKLDKQIEHIGVAPSLAAWKTAEAILSKATRFLKRGKIDKALQFCHQAMEIPSLLPENIGVIYETRAEIYLNKATKPGNDNAQAQQQVLLDLNEAIDLNERSWKAHYLLGQTYQLQDKLTEAISEFQKALIISPTQTKVRDALDGCKVKEAFQLRKDHLDPRIMPRDLDERLEILYNETSLKMTAEEFIYVYGERMGKLFPGQSETFQGNRYRNGWKCEPDYGKAIKWYAKAEEIGNPEGTYNLGALYEDGLGIEQNVGKALSLYHKAAEMSPDTPGIETWSFKKNVGVAAAQHAIGLMYHYGVGVDQDYANAIEWYLLAMMNGLGNSANNLGLILSEGNHASEQPDLPMAEMCWKLGMELKDLNAAAHLAVYYHNQVEPEKYKALVKTGREMGHHFLEKLTDAEVEKTVHELKMIRGKNEADLMAFEEKMKLPTKGWTFQVRCWRKLCFEGGEVDTGEDEGIFERKPYLRNPNRQGLLQQFRERMKFIQKVKICLLRKGAPKLTQTVPEDATNLKPITLVEMNPTKDGIYENRLLELLIIEEPILGFPAVNLLAEDENGDVVRLYIYNVKQDEKGLENLGVGCKIGIMNPYMRLTRQLTHGIRVDEPKCLVFRGKVEEMCRFCGEEEAEIKCGNCMRPYCSRECEMLDWKLFGHKKICRKL